MSPHCGRLDRHQPHEWIGRHATAWPVVYECPGRIVIGGGELDDETRARIEAEKAAERADDYWKDSA